MESPYAYALHKVICNNYNTPIDYEFIEVNTAFEQMTGLKARNIIGKKVTRVIPNIKDDDYDWIKEYGKIALEGGQLQTESYSNPIKKWFKVNAFSIEKGYFVTIFTDITSLKDSIDNYSSLITTLNDIVFELDSNYIFKKVFVVNEDMLFMPKKLFLGKSLMDIFPKEQSNSLIAAFKQAFLSGEKTSVVYKSIVPNDDRWFQANINYSDDKYIISITDITNEKKLKDELYLKTLELERFFSINLDLLCIVDTEGNFIKLSNEWENTLGYPIKYLERRNILDFIHEDDIDKTIKVMSELENNVNVLNFVNRYRCKDGNYKYIEWRSKPENNIIYAAARDVTDKINEKKDLELIINYSEYFLELINKEVDYNRITEDFRIMTESCVAAFNLYDENGLSYKTVGLSAEKAILNGALKKYRVKIKDRLWNHDSLREEKIKDNTVTRFNKLTDLTGKAMPKLLVNSMIRTFKLGQTIIVKIVNNGIMLGDFTIIMPRGKEFKKDNIAQVFSRQLGLIIHEKRIALKLKESEERYRLFSDVTLEGILIHQKGIPKDLNDSLCRMFRATREELLKKNLIDVIHKEDRHIAYKNIVDNHTKPYVVRAIRADGEMFYAELEGRSLILDGEALRVVSVRDISERIKNEQALIESNKRYDELARQSLTIAWEIDCNGVYTYINDTVYDILGYKPQEIVGKMNYSDLHMDNDFINFTPKIKHNKFKYTNIIYSVKHKDGHIVWLATNFSPIYNIDKELIGYRGSESDITEKKKLEDIIYNEKERFKTTLMSVGDGVISTDNEGKITFLNKIAEELTGWSLGEAYGQEFDQVFNIVNEITREKCNNPVKIVLETGNTIELANHTALISREGVETPIEDSAAPIRNEDGEITGAVLVFRDFTEKKDKQDKILYLSYNDQLTGLFNRRYFEEQIEILDNSEYFPLTLMLFDVNGLKLTNDAFGHLVGDKLLQTVADAFKKCCRQNEIICRIGGDEFIIILPKTDTNDADTLVKRIMQSLDNHNMDGIVLSVSYGYYTKHSTEQNIMDVFKKAEDYMYARKLSESQSMRHNTVNVILKTLYEKSQKEENHSKRVSDLCYLVGLAMDLDKDELNRLKIAGLMHDIGKIIMPDEMLNKRGEYTEEENEILKRHSETGYKILGSVNDFAPLAKTVLQHHENWDGTGYPNQLRGSDIDLNARIIAVANTYDKLTSGDEDNLDVNQAIDVLKSSASTSLDPNIVDIFIKDVILKKQ